MKVPGLPIGIRLPWIITIPLMLIVGIVWGSIWVVKKLTQKPAKPEPTSE
ncbi:MAG: hypothetical protein PHU49_15090 [Syntrophorhabdaceae bacterium]|nr:hypothetical protein [Syntrophorhabdaceae bacterium]